jgi:hypothetical protein
MLACGIMRTLLAAILLVALAGWSTDKPRHVYYHFDQHELTLQQVQHYADAYLPGIRQCYVEHAPRRAPGLVTLHVVVRRNGSIGELAIEAPGVTGKRLVALTACIQAEIDSWQFPVANSETPAILPYRFLKTR